MSNKLSLHLELVSLPTCSCLAAWELILETSLRKSPVAANGRQQQEVRGQEERAVRTFLPHGLPGLVSSGWFWTWLAKPNFLSLFPFQTPWFGFGAEKCGPWYKCALSSILPWRTVTFFYLEVESTLLVAWETKCTALYHLNVKRAQTFFCKKPIYLALSSPGPAVSQVREFSFIRKFFRKC